MHSQVGAFVKTQPVVHLGAGILVLCKFYLQEEGGGGRGGGGVGGEKGEP